MGKLRIINRRGDTRLAYNVVETEVLDETWDVVQEADAALKFQELRSQGYLAFTQRPDGNGAYTSEFDPNATIVMMQPIIGG